MLKRKKEFWEEDENEPLIKEKRLNLLKIIAFALIFVLFCRLFWIQVVFGKFWQDIALNNKIRLEKIKAPRGLIYSQDNMLLAQNVPTFSLVVSPSDLSEEKEKRQELLNNLKEELMSLGIEVDEEGINAVEEAPLYSYERITIKDGLSYEQFIDLDIRLKDWPGIDIVPSLKRQYPENGTFSHLIGYLSKISQEELKNDSYYSINDFYPKAGLEKEYELELRGKDGQKKIEVNSYGEEQKIIAKEDAHPGKDIVLTINGKFQKKIAELLEEYLKKLNLHYGTVIALNPQTGEVLAAFSLPTYDNNIFLWGHNEEKKKILFDTDHPLVFRATDGLYPSGSIIKGALAAGGLEEGIIKPDTQILSTGGINVGSWFFPDWKAGGHGRVNVIKALAESVNTFFYYLGGGYGNFKGLGVEGINHYLELFGFGDKTGIDIPNESSGLLPTPLWKEKVKGEPWYPGDTYHLSIGQGDILVTPLQVVNYTAAIANGGVLFRPHLVDYIIDQETGEKIYKESEIIRKDFISKENIEVVRQGFRAVVEEGSGRQLKYFEPKVAGKTGTAEILGKQPHAWFTCFAPYEEPEIVLTVLIENGGEGSTVAIPLAKEILTWWFENSKTF